MNKNWSPIKLLEIIFSQIIIVGIYISILMWFKEIRFYETRFFVHGHILTEYNLIRVAFSVAMAWFVYAPGAALLWLFGGRAALYSLLPGERYALGFFTGAGIWHIGLFLVGLAGGDTYIVVLALTILVILLSVPHLLICLKKAYQDFRHSFHSRNISGWNVSFIAILIISAGMFIIIKGIYPAGGHDYYDHYFYYYESVVRNGSIRPNEVWYHFYYSKGAGLYFLAMILTDPMAPQIVGTMYIAVGALTVAMILQRAAPGSWFPFIGAILYVTFLIYTPGPLRNFYEGGWGDLEKIHELTAVTFLGLLWICNNATSRNITPNKRMWLAGMICTIITICLLTTVAIFVVGAFLAALMAWGIFTRERLLILTSLLGGMIAAGSLAAVLAVNYAFTGIPLDRAILYVWPIVDLAKVNQWGVLCEVLELHFGLTGLLGQHPPLTWDIIWQPIYYLRLEIWWPIAVLGVGSLVWAAYHNKWRERIAVFDRQLALRNAVIFLLIYSVFVIGSVVGGEQTTSLYRFSSITYGPTLCVMLILCTTLPNHTGSRVILSGTVLGCVIGLIWLALSPVGPVIFGNNTATVYARGLMSVAENASYFFTGRFSLDDAYRNQQGWPGRVPWGGIYPAMENVWAIVGRGTPVYSLHVHSYCMLPDCRVFEWMSTRATPEMDVVLFGEPSKAIDALKKSNINYFFYSKELGKPGLGITSPIVASPVLAPDTISRYLGIKWTDGTSYLLTWLKDSDRPLDDDFLATYRIQAAPAAASFPLDAWKQVFAHFHEKGLHPYRLPWCLTCDGMSAD